MADEEITLPNVKKGIDEFSELILQYLDTGSNTKNTKIFIESYSKVIRICDEKDQGDEIYAYFKHLMTSFVAHRSIPSCMKLINSSKDFIKEYATQWKNYSFYYYSMKRMFEYLDRFYLKNLGNHAKSLTETALDLW